MKQRFLFCPLWSFERNSKRNLSATRSIASRSSRAGFSLVEIMIVLGIIGAIIALVGSRVVGANDKAKVRQAKVILSTVSDALSNYYSDCGKYPATLDGLLKADDTCSNWGPGAYTKPTANGKILDPWGNELEYSPKENGDFELKSFGRGGQPGGSSYEADISLDSSGE